MAHSHRLQRIRSQTCWASSPYMVLTLSIYKFRTQLMGMPSYSVAVTSKLSKTPSRHNSSSLKGLKLWQRDWRSIRNHVSASKSLIRAPVVSVSRSLVPSFYRTRSHLLRPIDNVMTGPIENANNLRLNDNKTLVVTSQLDIESELSIALIPNITSILQLKGKSLMVDSRDCRYAYKSPESSRPLGAVS